MYAAVSIDGIAALDSKTGIERYGSPEDREFFLAGAKSCQAVIMGKNTGSFRVFGVPNFVLTHDPDLLQAHDPAGAIRKWNRRAASVQPNVRPIDGNALYRTAVNRAEKKGIYFNEMDRVISPKDIEDAPTIILSAPAGGPSSGAARHLPPGEGGDGA